jgi:hypothetical protein
MNARDLLLAQTSQSGLTLDRSLFRLEAASQPSPSELPKMAQTAISGLSILVNLGSALRILNRMILKQMRSFQSLP